MNIRPVEPSSSMRTDGRTDIHDEANSRFSQFYERAWQLCGQNTELIWLYIDWPLIRKELKGENIQA